MKGLDRAIRSAQKERPPSPRALYKQLLDPRLPALSPARVTGRRPARARASPRRPPPARRCRRSPGRGRRRGPAEPPPARPARPRSGSKAARPRPAIGEGDGGEVRARPRRVAAKASGRAPLPRRRVPPGACARAPSGAAAAMERGGGGGARGWSRPFLMRLWLCWLGCYTLLLWVLRRTMWAGPARYLRSPLSRSLYMNMMGSHRQPAPDARENHQVQPRRRPRCPPLPSLPFPHRARLGGGGGRGTPRPRGAPPGRGGGSAEGSGGRAGTAVRAEGAAGRAAQTKRGNCSVLRWESCRAERAAGRCRGCRLRRRRGGSGASPAVPAGGAAPVPAPGAGRVGARAAPGRGAPRVLDVHPAFWMCSPGCGCAPRFFSVHTPHMSAEPCESAPVKFAGGCDKGGFVITEMFVISTGASGGKQTKKKWETETPTEALEP